MEYIATLGPSCADAETLSAMLNNGMTALRLNLSHGGLNAHPEWLDAFSRACAGTGRRCGLLLDLQGPELRCGNAAPVLLTEGTQVTLGTELPVPQSMLTALRTRMRVSLDDGRLLLRVTDGTHCRIERGGTLPPRKSAAIEGVELPLPPLTDEDRRNLSRAGSAGVTAVMLSFTRGPEDIAQTRTELQKHGLFDIKIVAKIENNDGVKNIYLIAKEADAVCIARGDLGNRMPLWTLPALQRRLARVCASCGTPFFIATELLSSMEHCAVPTRAEMNDIFCSAFDGAGGFILTGETAVGRYPAEAVSYLRRAAEEALRVMREEC